MKFVLKVQADISTFSMHLLSYFRLTAHVKFVKAILKVVLCLAYFQQNIDIAIVWSESLPEQASGIKKQFSLVSTLKNKAYKTFLQKTNDSQTTHQHKIPLSFES